MNNITIAIPTYNRLRLLQEALKSVEQQTDSNFNLLIVDNYSDDGTTDFLKEFQRTTNVINLEIFLNDHNIGLVKNINKCFKLATTKFVTILSDDDFLEDNFIEIVNKALVSEENGMLVVGHNIVGKNLNIINKFYNESKSFSLQESFKSLFYERIHIAGISGVVFNKILCEKTLYMKDFPNGLYSDFEMYYRLSISHGLSTINTVVYNRRQWEDNTSVLRLNWQFFKKVYLQNKAYAEFVQSLELIIKSHESLFLKDEFKKLNEDFEKSYKNNFIIELLRNKIKFFKRVE